MLKGHFEDGTQKPRRPTGKLRLTSKRRTATRASSKVGASSSTSKGTNTGSSFTYDIRSSTSASSALTKNTIKSMHKRFEVSVSPIRTDEDLDWSLAELGKVLDAELGTIEDARREVLSELIYAYEQKHHAIEPPSPIDAIKFRLDQAGLKRKVLEPIMGGRGRVSEIMSGKRELSKEMIRRLHKEFGIPLKSLLGA
jgi:HTH-type transcriptional regulator/antitoxin HigA